MRKLRPDSTWNRLTPGQKQTLEGWLFDENIRYREALTRVLAQFGIKTSMRSLAEYYNRLARERWLRQVMEVKARFREFDGENEVWRLIANAASARNHKRKPAQNGAENPKNRW